MLQDSCSLLCFFLSVVWFTSQIKNVLKIKKHEYLRVDYDDFSDVNSNCYHDLFFRARV